MASTIPRSSVLIRHSLSRQLHRLIDLQIPRASTQIAQQRILDLVARRRRIYVEERAGREKETGCAVAALGSAQLREGVLKRMQRSTPRHSLDGFDRALGVRLCQRQTRENRRPIDQHGACAALAQLAPMLRARQTEVFTKDLEQCLVRRKRDFHALVVDDERLMHLLSGRRLDGYGLSRHT